MLGHPLAATIGDSARCMQNLEKVLFTGPKTSDTVTFIGVVAPLWLRANAPMVVAEVCSTMKYPKRSQYKHAKQKKYHVRNWAEYNERAAPPRRFDGLV